MTSPTQKNIIPILSRSLLSYLVFAVLSLVSRLLLPYWLRSNWTANDKAMVPIIYISFALSLFYLYRQIVIALSDYAEELAYTPADKSLFDLKYTLRLINNKSFWLLLSPKLFLITVIPSSLIFYPLVQLIGFFGINQSGVISWTVIKLFIAACILFTETAARKRIRKKQGRSPLFSGLSEVISAVLGYLGLSTGMIITFYFLYCTIKLLTSPNGLKNLLILSSPLAVLLILIFGFGYLRALIIRHKFLRKLKKVCKSQGAVICNMYRPYLSIIRPGTKHSFTLKYGKRLYECQLLAAVNKNAPVFISPEGAMEIKHYFVPRFIRKKMLGTGAGFFTTSLDLHWEGHDPEAESVLILSPVSSSIFSGNVIKNSLIDVGSRVGDYTVYNGTGFINAIERDCLCTKKR